MIQNCQQFEQRIQQLMDDRIDPETDELICAHTLVCSDCYESMMAYSVLHTSYLTDSDSMKIKLETLGLQNLIVRKRDQPNRRHLFAVAASIAAMILLLVAMTNESLFDLDGTGNVAELSPAIASVEFNRTSVGIQSLVRIKDSLAENEIISYSNGLPGIPHFKVLSVCFDWFQKSFLGFPKKENDDLDLGQTKDLNLDRQFSSYMHLAART